MLSQNAFEVWCQKLALSEQAKAALCQIRSSPLSRLVRSAAGNVSGRYPSKKFYRMSVKRERKHSGRQYV